MENELRFIFHYKNHNGDKWLSGQFNPSLFSYSAVQQFILLNIRNVTLKMLYMEDVADMLIKIGQQRPHTLDHSIVLGITNGFVDTGLSFFNVYDNSFKLFHISPPVQTGYYVIVTALSASNVTSEQYNILGLDNYVWIGTTLSIVFLAFFLVGIKCLMTKVNTWSLSMDVLSSFLSNIWYFTAILLEHPQGNRTVTLPVRILILTWLVSSTILMKAYLSNLKGDLLVNKNHVINSIEDLAERPDIFPVARKHDSITFTIKNSPRSDYALLRKIMKKRKRNMYYEVTVGEALERSWDGKYAYFMYAPYVNYYVSEFVGFRILNNNGKLAYIGDTKYEVKFDHLFFNKNLSATILERVDYLTARFVETDQLFPLRNIDDFKFCKLIYKRNQISALKPLITFFLMPVFEIWMAGIVASIPLAFMEFFYKS